MSSCLLVRHGATDMAGRFCGHSDPPLNAAGWLQARKLVESLASSSPHTIFASDLLRARQTAQGMAAHFAVPLKIRPGLREIHFGDWEGLPWRDIEARWPKGAANWIEEYPAGAIPGGEAFHSFQLRVREEMEFLLAQASRRPVVAVTHAGFIRTALVDVMGFSEEAAREQSGSYGAIVSLPPGDILPEQPHDGSE